MIEKLETEADSIHFVSFDFPRASSAEALYNASSLADKSFDENPDSVKEWIEQKTGRMMSSSLPAPYILFQK